MIGAPCSATEAYADAADAEGPQRLLLHASRLATAAEMAAGIGHELNQPLTAIANYAQACERMLGLPGVDRVELQEALRQISNEAIRAGDILRRLRAQTRSHNTQRVPADINAVIRQIGDLLGHDARAHRGRVVLELSDPLPQVLIDSVQVQQALFNLASNGIEARAPDGSEPEVRIRTRLAADGSIEVAVHDQGPGLTPLALERLFEPFFSTKAGGIGLGLSISSTLIRAQEGTLGYRPNVPAGACFFFLLPVYCPASAASPEG